MAMFAENIPISANFLSTSVSWSGDRTRSSMQESSSVVSETLQKAIAQLIRPLVKAMIDSGITFPVLMDQVRRIYVEVAQSTYGIDGKPPTDSRVTLITGVHRKEIKRLRSEAPLKQTPSEKISLSARVIAIWCSKPEYLDERGHPIALPRTSADGKVSLEQLVTSVSVDVRPRTLLEEWISSGIAELEDGKVRLIKTALIPSKGFEEKAYFFGRNLRDHIAAGAHNLSDTPPVFFDRTVYYDRIAPDSVEELRQLCAKRGEELLLEINRHVRQLAERDRAEGEPRGRMTFGAYFFAEDDAGDASDKS